MLPPNIARRRVADPDIARRAKLERDCGTRQYPLLPRGDALSHPITAQPKGEHMQGDYGCYRVSPTTEDYSNGST